jgi:FAD synthase
MNKLPEIVAPVVTPGSFDGVHAGYRDLSSLLVEVHELIY